VAAETVSNYPGLAPNLLSLSDRAISAANVDLSGGGIRPTRPPSFVEAGHTGEIAYFNGTWRSGRSNYIPTDLAALPVLISQDNGQWLINVNDIAEAPLWIAQPTEFSLEASELPVPSGVGLGAIGAGNIEAGEYEYFVRFRDTLDGEVIRESEASAPLTVTIPDDGSSVVVVRPFYSGLDTTRITWVVYRRVSGTNYAYEVAETNLALGTVIDTKLTNDLGASILPETTEGTKIEYQYVIVWVRDVGGWVQESVPSPIAPARQAAEGVKITLTQVAPAGVQSWRIYRISTGIDPTTTFQLVTELPVGTTEYIDVLDNIELTSVLASSYRTANGAIVTAGVPDAEFTGMAGPFNGFYVGWIGRDFYMSEPGNPSWWPGAFVVEANADIVGVTEVGNNLAVVTADGVQFGYGTTPESFTLAQARFGVGASHRTAINREYYLGYDGIYLIQENSVTRVTKSFGEDYFLDLEVDNPWLISENEQLLLSFDAGALRFDTRSSKWTTLSDAYVRSAHKEREGEIYAVRNGSIVKLYGSTNEYDSMNYEVAGVTFATAQLKNIESAHFYGSGELSVIMKDVDGTELVNTTVDMDSTYRPDSTVYLPAYADLLGLRMSISGTGVVRDVMFELAVSRTEK